MIMTNHSLCNPVQTRNFKSESSKLCSRTPKTCQACTGTTIPQIMGDIGEEHYVQKLLNSMGSYCGSKHECFTNVSTRLVRTCMASISCVFQAVLLIVCVCMCALCVRCSVSHVHVRHPGYVLSSYCIWRITYVLCSSLSLDGFGGVSNL